MKTFLQLPSTASWKQKKEYLHLASHLDFDGISISSLPSNQDIFQVLNYINYEYKFDLGIAILSPFFTSIENIVKSITTFADIIDHKKSFFIAFGIGDKITIKNSYPNLINPVKQFIERIEEIKNILIERDYVIDFQIAGSGNKLLDYAVQNNLGILYNGKLISEKYLTYDKLNIFLMSHFGSLQSTQKGQMNIILKMLINLPKFEKNRLNISDKMILDVKKAFNNHLNDNNFRNFLSEDIINKIAYIGNPEGLSSLISQLDRFRIKNLVLSHAPVEQWSQIRFPS
ncbi:MAG: hypothetical protein ACFFD1_07745 [Candidatus Thorarchaeota archaeon]